jgi:hypothetical protein
MPQAPMSFKTWDQSPSNRAIITKMINGNISILPLFDCEEDLFREIQEEAMRVVKEEHGQAVDLDHPTYKNVSSQDPSWTPKENSLGQWSLFNSRHDFSFAEEDHHWQATDRQFNKNLKAIPKFFELYFPEGEMQNCRLNLVDAKGSLGLHREKIVGIPKREDDFKLRFHLPLVTNPNVLFIMDGKKYTMKEGTVYGFNQGCLHGVSNNGNALRVHMIFDMYLNPQILSLFAGAQ